MCFGGRKTREERKICLKISLFGFPQTLVFRPVTTAARKVVSPSTLIGPFEFERALKTRPSTGGKCTFCRESSVPLEHFPPVAMDGVVCLSILLEGRVTVSNNSTKRRQNGSKIGIRDKFATYLRKENFISNEIAMYTIFLGSVIFHTILYIHKLSHTPRILSLGSLWFYIVTKQTTTDKATFISKSFS